MDDGKATGFGVVLNDELVDSGYLTFDEKNNKLTISKEALHSLNAGEYSIGFVFNDTLTTTITDQVTVTVTGTNPYLQDGSEEHDTD